MNLVAVLIAPAVVGMSALSGEADPLRYAIAAVAVAAIAVAVTISIRRGVVLEDPADGEVASVEAQGGAGG
jgi:K(+)-stimulated pyrophosphate-energized sodium pump